MHYSEMFKCKMIQKMTGPDAISATALSKQVEVPQSTLSKWFARPVLNHLMFILINLRGVQKWLKR